MLTLVRTTGWPCRCCHVPELEQDAAVYRLTSVPLHLGSIGDSNAPVADHDPATCWRPARLTTPFACGTLTPNRPWRFSDTTAARCSAFDGIRSRRACSLRPRTIAGYACSMCETPTRCDRSRCPRTPKACSGIRNRRRTCWYVHLHRPCDWRTSLTIRSPPRQVSTESGRVICFDATKPDDQPVMVLDAHAKAISSMDLNPNVPGLLITVSVDKTFKIWDLTPTTPVLLHSETVAVRFDLALSWQTRCSLTWRAAGFRSNCSRSRGIPTFRSCSPSVARARSRPCQHSSSTACTESSTQRRLPKSLLNELTPPPYPHVVICRVYPRIASKSILLLHLSALTSSSFVVVDAILRPRSINQPINQSVNQSINQPL